jgi:hypothetical protein
MHINPSMPRPNSLAAQGNEIHRIIRRNPCLLRLETGIDLDVEARCLALPLHFRGKSARNLFAIDRFDHIEQGDGFRSLVGLQRADQVKLDVGVPPSAPATCLGFLNPVFTEHALPCGNRRTDHIGIEGLGNGNERCGPPGRPAASSASRSAPDIVQSLFQFHRLPSSGRCGE